MSIGLYDADFFTYHQTIFNLEIMKLATYFKRKREITIMAPSFAPERYTHFYYRKDFNDGKFRHDLNQYSNLIYGGFAFSNNHYVPLLEEIEQCAPDVSIYERYKDLFIENSPSNKNYYSTLMNGIHFRLSLNGNSIWKDFERQIPKGTKGRVFFLHDYNLNNIKNSAEMIQKIIQKYCLSEQTKISICTKFPVNCFDFESFSKWLNFTFSSTGFNLQYNGLMNDAEINEIVQKINQTQARNIFYNPLPASYGSNDFLESDLLKIFTQVLFLYKNNKQFLLICNDNFQVPEEIKKMFNLFTAYGRSNFKDMKPTSLFYFAKQLRKINQYKNEIITLPEAIQVFSYTQKNYPELFKLFYENSGAIYRGGELQLE